jgi:D-amino peptidase
VRVHISVDMEGTSGVADASDVIPGAPHYERSRELMTDDANAAVAGAFDAGATEVVVNDSHDGMLNLLQERMDRRALVIRGSRKTLGMMEGLTRDTVGTVFIGYHAAAGSADGVLNHTMLASQIQAVYLNDELAGELRLNAALAACFGVPVLAVSGDDVVCTEARQTLGAVETIEVKKALSKYAAILLHPGEAQTQIQSAVCRAVETAATVKPYPMVLPVSLRILWNSTAIAGVCTDIPGVVRTGPREVEYSGDDFRVIYRLFRVLMLIGSSIGSREYTYD